MRRIELHDGKYIILNDNGVLKAYRHGDYLTPWREADLVGDGLILALVQRVEELEDDLENLRDDFLTYRDRRCEL
jgi:hypothetical protein